MFSNRIPEHVIDLTAPEEDRWSRVIKTERVALRRIVRAALTEYEQAGLPSWGRLVGTSALDALYRLWGGRYVGELDAIATAAGVTRAECVAGNCAYEMSHAVWWAGATWERMRSPFGCTAGLARAADGTPLSCSVFFVVAGAAAGEGCVIERTPREAVVRRMRGSHLVQANHFESRRLSKLNAGIKEEDEDGASLYYDSDERAQVMSQELAGLARRISLDEAAVVLRKRPVSSIETTQRILMAPASGEWRAWRRVG